MKGNIKPQFRQFRDGSGGGGLLECTYIYGSYYQTAQTHGKPTNVKRYKGNDTGIFSSEDKEIEAILGLSNREIDIIVIKM